MIAPILIITLIMVTGIQSENIDCPHEDWRKIRECQYDAYGKSYNDPCELLELGINCTQYINEKCTKDGYFANYVLPGPLTSQTHSCFNQRFDEFFNQDGLCSFQDVKDIYKCYRNARDNNDIPWPCSEAQIVETCIKETNKNCMGLYHRQFPMFVANEVIERYNGPEGRGVLPKCLKAFPSDTTDDYDDEFPTLKKLDDELNKLLKNH